MGYKYAEYKNNPYNMKSDSQAGSLPFTEVVVDFTFCSFKVTYVLNWSEKYAKV